METCRPALKAGVIFCQARKRIAITLSLILAAACFAAAAEPRAAALAEATSGRYAPCSLVWLSGAEAWLLALRAGEGPTLQAIGPGWHAITHFELDDPADRRAAWLLAQLGAWRPRARAEAEARLRALIASHGSDEAPPVCLHAGRAPTVSAAAVWVGPDGVTYRHAQGPPCVTPFADVPLA